MATKKRRTATSSPRRRRSSKQQGNKLPYYAALLVIGAAAIVVYNRYISPSPVLTSSSQKVVASKPKSKQSFVEPDYQFYTLLPQGNGTQQTVAATAKPATTATPVVATPTQNAKTAAATTATATTPAAKAPAPVITATPTVVTPPSHHYVLQLAAFKRYEDADELKARLILQGYPTTISSTTVNGTVWYRLSIGPYTTTADAKIVQAKLEQTHLVSHTQVIAQ